MSDPPHGQTELGWGGWQPSGALLTSHSPVTADQAGARRGSSCPYESRNSGLEWPQLGHISGEGHTMAQIDIEILTPFAAKFMEGTTLTPAERAEVLRIAQGFACKDSAAAAGVS